MIGLLEFRPTVHHGEPAHGALVRAATLHGVASPQDFAKFLGLNFNELLDGVGVESVAELLGAERGLLRYWSPQMDKMVRRVSIAGESFRRRQIARGHRRWCEECWLEDELRGGAEAIHHRSEWDVLPLSCCARHGTALQERCWSCGNQVTWRVPAVHRCQCGACLLVGVSKGRERYDEAGRFDVYIRDRLHGKSFGLWADQKPLGSLIPLADALGLAELFGNCRRKPVAADRDLRAIRERGFQMIKNGPDGLLTCFDRLSSRSSRSAGLTAAYGWFYDWLCGASADELACDVIELLERHARACEIIAPGERIMGAPTSETVSLGEAAQMLGMAHQRARRLLSCHQLIPSGSRRGVSFRIQREAVEQLAEAKGRDINLSQLADLLGIGSNQTRALVEAGHLQPLPGSVRGGPKLFSPDDVALLVRRLLKPRAGDRRQAALTPLPDACQATGVSISLAVRGLVAGELFAARLPGGGLRCIGVRPGDLRKLRAGGPVSLSDAASRLELHPEATLALLRKGLLKGTRAGRRWQVSEREIARFRGLHASARQLARASGLTIGLARKALFAAGVAPLLAPRECRQQIFKRETAEQALCHLG